MKILYICTHNRCRSILSEAVTNHRAGDLLVARSAGSQPVGAVHPLSLRYLDEAGYPTAGLTSQSWSEFEDFGPDVVITLCNSAAGEACPVWFGHAVRLHWGLTDPSKLDGDQAQDAFRQTIVQIEQRVDALSKIAAADPRTWPAALKELTTP